MRASEELQDHPQIASRALPDLVNVKRSIGRVLERWPNAVGIPQEKDREALALEMARRIEAWDWKNVKTSRITSAAVAIFDTERSDRLDLLKVRQFYLNEISACAPGSFLDAMVWIYIESFDPTAQHTKELANALLARANELGAKCQNLLQAIPSLFDLKNAHTELAGIMLEADDPYRALKEIGFRSPHGQGLVQHAHSAFVEKTAPHLRQKNERDRLMCWLMPETGSVLQAGAGSAVEALLAVWENETPSDEVRHEISEAIINAYNDPRLHRGGIWSGFDPSLREILLRWLTKQDMKFFCDMVTATQNSHMWPPRRDFWLELYEDKMIDEAWVAFGASARQYAQRQLLGSGAANLNRRFARQLDRGGKTSLLIMRIGNKIVVDGCHNYRTHIFRADDPSAPKLYAPTYECDRIMHRSKLAKSHSAIHTWKTWVMQHV